MRSTRNAGSGSLNYAKRQCGLQVCVTNGNEYNMI